MITGGKEQWGGLSVIQFRSEGQLCRCDSSPLPRGAEGWQMSDEGTASIPGEPGPLGAGATCASCGFRYWEHRGHIIACPVCALAIAQHRADAALAVADSLRRVFGVEIAACESVAPLGCEWAVEKMLAGDATQVTIHRDHVEAWMRFMRHLRAVQKRAVEAERERGAMRAERDSQHELVIRLGRSCDEIKTARNNLERQYNAARADLGRAVEAIRETLLHFFPEHLDSVSGSRCGSLLHAVLTPSAVSAGEEWSRMQEVIDCARDCIGYEYDEDHKGTPVFQPDYKYAPPLAKALRKLDALSHPTPTTPGTAKEQT